MIKDKQNELSSAQAITTTANSTNAIDLGPAFGPGGYSDGSGDAEVVLTVDEAFTAAGAATLQVQVCSSANANLSSPVVHDQSDVLTKAELTIGSKVRFRPRIPIEANRYFFLNYVVATGPMTAGKITAGVVTGRQTNF